MINKFLKDFIQKKITVILFTLMCFFIPYITNAASLYLLPSSSSISAGNIISMKVMVDTGGKVINNAEAVIEFPTDLLEVISITKSSSIFSMWVENPSFSNYTGKIGFNGGVPNPGFNGKSGYIASITFKAKKQGTASVLFSEGVIRENDGLGTNILTSKNTSIIKIEAPKKVEAKPVVKVAETPKKIVSVKDTTIVISEIKNNILKYSPNKFLIISPQSVPDESYSIQIDSNASITWIDDGSHVFEAPILENGIHNIKVMAVDTNSDKLSGFLNFSTTVLKIPIITYYPNDLYVDQFLVLKGTADPMIDVELSITNNTTGGIMVDHVFTNSDGKFIYVPDDKMQAGTYSIVARSTTINGISSNYMDPIQVIIKDHKLNFFVGMFTNYITLLIPFIALIALIIIILLFIYYRIKKFHKYLNNKLSNTENIVSRSFEILDEDAEEEIAIFRKIRTNKILDKDEQVFLGKFKKDIIEAEKVIQKELKEIEKRNDN